MRGSTPRSPALALDTHGIYSATRGWLDTRYRQSLATQTFVDPGQPFGMTIVEKPQDYTFKKGHFIGLTVQTEINDWSLPKAYPNCTSVRINWEKGETTVTLPAVNAPRTPATVFESGS